MLPVADRVSLTVKASFLEWVTHPVTQIAGRIRSFASNWKTISSDPWVLSIVSEGFKLEFTSSPFLSAPASNMHMSETQLKICNEEVSGFIRKGVVMEVSVQEFVSGFFLVPKSCSAWRPIVNLKALHSCHQPCLPSL